MRTPRSLAVVLVLALSLTLLPDASAGYKEDSRFAADRLRAAFFQEDRSEMRYAWRALVISCASESMSSIAPVPAVSPACESQDRVLSQGCGSGDASEATDRCVGRFVEAEVVRERHWPEDLRTLLRDISTRLRIARQGV